MPAGTRGRGERPSNPIGARGWRRTGPPTRTSRPSWERRLRGELPADWPDASAAETVATAREGSAVATRKASQLALERFAPSLPELVGGSADLTGSNLTTWTGSRPVSREAPDGNYVYFGVREFAMFAILNGMALHGGVIPYAGTFPRLHRTTPGTRFAWPPS